MKVKNKLLISFTENMAALVNSGMSILDSLKICKKISQTEDNLMLCNKLLEKLEEGESFSNSLRLTSNSFDNLYSSLIKIGEITGNVKTVIKKLDEYLKQKKDMRDKLKAALAYPILVLITSIFVIAVILIFVIPKLISVFEIIANGNESFSLMISKVVYSTKFGIGIIIFIVFLLLMILFLYKINNSVKFKIDKMLFYIPFVSNYQKMICSYDFSFAMKLLCESGIPLVIALEESKKSINNSFYIECIELVKNEISNGNSFSESLKNKIAFPNYFSIWVQIGETTGEVSAVFNQIYNFYNNQSKNLLNQFSSNAESFFILISGILVFVLVLNFVVPIFNILGSF